MTEKTIISILIPCYNEEKFIGKCLDSVRAFEIPDGCETEVLVIDGMSADKTREIVAAKIMEDPGIRLIDNPGRIQSYALNTAIPLSKGSYILRLDSHSDYPVNYLKLLYETALRTGADNTGGLVITRPFNKSYRASVVQALTTHKFGVGNSGFRVGMKEGPADTVPYGFFKRSIFNKIGYFDERLVRAQDYEFNRRIWRAGGTIWLNPEVQLNYYNQPDMHKFLKKQLLYEAPYNAYMWFVAPYTFAYRHAITAVFFGGIIGGMLLSLFVPVLWYVLAAVMAVYFLLAIISSVQQAVRYKKFLHVFTLPVCFFLYHFLHGSGVVWGLLRLLTRTAPIFKKPKTQATK
ncbi:MAG TPA: glycosyltransferase family 2 protein [Bacteroidales bacterium]|jgi:glycosyltransferase involved in cell wall biosynthesis|nr:glycosyltransferase family 2 protein [Bacteroidales bacterium]HNZ43734.1 glycosyltransferase family 2 protein [Bacteroidales bacterium]HOH84426.1 glycosyltransferase family 2 protein [Bacteroidales bacterium]HPB24152.1 glycosyltransferase family 2 protein [Bacteroidales bacterium]HPI29560.1 glycosyltransferase family 2 protein [Bacteroidales bacterium]